MPAVISWSDMAGLNDLPRPQCQTRKLSAELDKTKKDVEDLKEKLRQAEAALESEKLSRSNKETAASQLASQLEQATREKDALDQQLKEKKNETIANLEKNVEKELEERGEALRGMEIIAKEKDDLVTRLQEASSSMTQLKEDKNASTREVEGLRAQLLSAQDQLEKEKECRAKAVTEAARFEVALASKTTAHATMSTMYQNTQHTISSLMRDVQSFQKQVDTLQAKLNASDSDVARLRGELAQAKTDKDDAMILMQYTRSETERSIHEVKRRAFRFHLMMRLENADIGAMPQIATASTAASIPTAMEAVLQKASELPQTPLPTATSSEAPPSRRGVSKPRADAKTPTTSKEASMLPLAVETRRSLRMIIASLSEEDSAMPSPKADSEKLPALPKETRNNPRKGAMAKKNDDEKQDAPKRGRRSSFGEPSPAKSTKKQTSPSTNDELPDVKSYPPARSEDGPKRIGFRK